MLVCYCSVKLKRCRILRVIPTCGWGSSFVIHCCCYDISIIFMRAFVCVFLDWFIGCVSIIYCWLSTFWWTVCMSFIQGWLKSLICWCAGWYSQSGLHRKLYSYRCKSASIQFVSDACYSFSCYWGTGIPLSAFDDLRVYLLTSPMFKFSSNTYFVSYRYCNNSCKISTRLKW